jgi:hypothetical protein
MLATEDGGCLVSSWGMGAVVFKIDRSGTMEWQKIFQGGHHIAMTHILEESEGGCVTAGYIIDDEPDPDRWDLWLARFDESFDVVWHGIYEGPGSINPKDFQPVSTGGFVVAGELQYEPWIQDALVLRLDADGNILWQRTYGGPSPDGFTFVREVPGGGFLAGGTTCSFDEHFLGKMWLVKMNDLGEVSDSCPEGMGAAATLGPGSVDVTVESSSLLVQRGTDAVVSDTGIEPVEGEIETLVICAAD